METPHIHQPSLAPLTFLYRVFCGQDNQEAKRVLCPLDSTGGMGETLSRQVGLRGVGRGGGSLYKALRNDKTFKAGLTGHHVPHWTRTPWVSQTSHAHFVLFETLPVISTELIINDLRHTITHLEQ